MWRDTQFLSDNEPESAFSGSTVFDDLQSVQARLHGDTC
jgi:hypothetical protein